MVQRHLHRLSTPRAAALAGVLFALLFGASIALSRIALPAGAEPGSQWAAADSNLIRAASLLMPFAGIAFLWFIGVVRDGFGRYEDKVFASVFLGSGLLFLAMVFASTAVGMAWHTAAPMSLMLRHARRSLPSGRCCCWRPAGPTPCGWPRCS